MGQFAEQRPNNPLWNSSQQLLQMILLKIVTGKMLIRCCVYFFRRTLCMLPREFMIPVRFVACKSQVKSKYCSSQRPFPPPPELLCNHSCLFLQIEYYNIMRRRFRMSSWHQCPAAKIYHWPPWPLWLCEQNYHLLHFFLLLWGPEGYQATA